MLRPLRGVANGLLWEEITLASNNERFCQEWFQAILQLLNGKTFIITGGLGHEDGGHPRGVSIFMLRPKRGVANGLLWEEITLASNNERFCQEWFQAILQLLNGKTFIITGGLGA